MSEEGQVKELEVLMRSKCMYWERMELKILEGQIVEDWQWN